MQRFEAQRVLESTGGGTIEQKLADIRRLLLVHDKILFSDFFRLKSKRHLIVIFLALLELVASARSLALSEKDFEEIQITKANGKPSDPMEIDRVAGHHGSYHLCCG